MVFSEASSSSYGDDGPLLSPHPISNSSSNDNNSSSSSHLSSQSKTFANVFIAIVGAGVLGLPYAFRRTGWAAGVLMLLLVGALTYHCMLLLVRTRRRLSLDPSSASKIASFGDLGLAVSGPLGRAAVDSMIVLSQAGFCVGYLLFVSDTLAHLLPSSPKSLYIWAMFPFQLALNSIPSLTHLAPLSIFADVVDIGAMGVVMAEDLSLFLSRRGEGSSSSSSPSPRAFAGPSVLLYGLGVAVYAFEGIGMVLPLELEAADKDRFGRTLGVSMAFISAMYALFGALGYLAFGDDTRDIITTNFGGGWVTLLVQIGLCVNLFFTFPIMMHPVYEVAERWCCGKRYCLWLRWALVVAVSLVAMLVPNFADFLSLVGSSVCCLLGFVLPALFHLRVFSAEMGWAGAASDVAIIAVGLVFAVSGTWSSLHQIFSSSS
ncbi:amino acid transport protein [Iris pallida]|uniref:Amino acid transport protein n=1 Tax=Iris pallida TaxID=29817 RepID=A0AAX6IEW5_IRIPA|nr:amino acid transport protein [Iris pallida]